MRGAVDVRDFLLTAPDRLVLDVVGATLSDTAAALYDGVKRGGVLQPPLLAVPARRRPHRARPRRPQGRTRSSASGRRRPGELRHRRGLPGLVVGRGRGNGRWSTRPRSRRAGARRRRRRKAGGRRVRSTAPSRSAPASPRITVTWDRASIADVVAGFAAFSGRTIILGKDIKGEVTAEMKNQPWPHGLPGDARHPGPLGPGDGRRHHPGGRAFGARRARLARAAGDQHRPDQLRPAPARSPRRSRAS